MGDDMQKLGSLVGRSMDARAAYDELLSLPQVEQVIKAYECDIDMSLLSNFISDIDEYVRNLERCEGCKGLKTCRQPVKGHHPALHPKQNQLKVSYTPCQYQLNQNHLVNIKSFHMPVDVLNATFETFILDPNRAEVQEKAIMFIHQYLTEGKAKGLFLYGSFGTGKTYMLSAIANELSKQGKVCGIVYFPELIAEVKASFNSENSSAYDKIELLKTIDVLMLDDIGSESMSSWMRDELLGRILNYRMHQDLPTFFTSNFDYSELQYHYSHTQKGEVEEIKGARILERIKALTIPVKLTGTNYRQNR
ncbi:MAG: primosomal protein DnaI [Turicibacter sp.]